MKRQFFIILVALLSFTAASAQCTSNEFPYIEVNGIAKASVDPNRAEVSITLDQSNYKTKTSMKELENQLISALNSAGIDIEKQLTIASQTSEAQKLKGASQFKKYILTVTSSSEAQSVFAAFAEHGVKNAKITRIWSDQEQEIDKKLKAEAVINARKSAENIAGALGQSIGKAYMIVDVSGYGIEQSMAVYDYGVAGAAYFKQTENSDLSEIDFRKINIERIVRVKFHLN